MLSRIPASGPGIAAGGTKASRGCRPGRPLPSSVGEREREEGEGQGGVGEGERREEGREG